jgi:hypothetical protein
VEDLARCEGGLEGLAQAGQAKPDPDRPEHKPVADQEEHGRLGPHPMVDADRGDRQDEHRQRNDRDVHAQPPL